jgi:ABC-type xylose transport system permease subunit
VKQRVAARLLLASCTLALGLGLGTAIAVTGLAKDEADLAAVGRGLLIAIVFTALAVLLAARALITASRLRSSATPDPEQDDS